ncbi:hypothetical protein M406DRAFT_332645 [Cryphonectria parasitica EP155]|uniref:Uncharacterized protein n=1 Tax=Cryphonectria parasitica (strain ATCC 38755 / EP155) TaxID=660469 RepID=A0A9P5CLQ3_CRYP1|nr:uncharacterized protein M406DRAFT_332645 [Cryphonectria parasitica EP155]KAF3762261.1 hypothetical protein M406DRAFT_332645 [Cryphonectria parasitica EP155]
MSQFTVQRENSRRGYSPPAGARPSVMASLDEPPEFAFDYLDKNNRLLYEKQACAISWLADITNHENKTIASSLCPPKYDHSPASSHQPPSPIILKATQRRRLQERFQARVDSPSCSSSEETLQRLLRGYSDSSSAHDIEEIYVTPRPLSKTPTTVTSHEDPVQISRPRAPEPISFSSYLPHHHDQEIKQSFVTPSSHPRPSPQHSKALATSTPCKTNPAESHRPASASGPAPPPLPRLRHLRDFISGVLRFTKLDHNGDLLFTSKQDKCGAVVTSDTLRREAQELVEHDAHLERENDRLHAEVSTLQLQLDAARRLASLSSPSTTSTTDPSSDPPPFSQENADLDRRAQDARITRMQWRLDRADQFVNRCEMAVYRLRLERDAAVRDVEAARREAEVLRAQNDVVRLARNRYADRVEDLYAALEDVYARVRGGSQSERGF